MARLFQSGGLVSVEKMPVHGSSLADLDMRRLEDYFLNVLGEDAVADWQRTLLNRELLIADEWRPEVRTCSYAAIVLFAREPRRRMPQAGIRLLVFPRNGRRLRCHAGRRARHPVCRPEGTP